MKKLLFKAVFVAAVVGLGLAFREALAPTLTAQAAIIQLNNSVDSTATAKSLIGLINSIPTIVGLLALLVFVPDVKKAFEKKPETKEGTVSA